MMRRLVNSACRLTSQARHIRYGFAYEKNHSTFNDVEETYTMKLEPAKVPEKIPAFRVIDLEGNVVAPEYESIPKETLNKIFDTMV